MTIERGKTPPRLSTNSEALLQLQRYLNLREQVLVEKGNSYRSSDLLYALIDDFFLLNGGKPNYLSFQGFLLDYNDRTVTTPIGHTTALQPTYFSFMELLMLRNGKRVSTESLAELLPHPESIQAGVRTVISNLRKSIKDTQHQYIKTAQGVGYYLVGDSNSAHPSDEDE